ncbi:hypothetical protein AOQ84DRAFT_360674 [Glonium stellatum]|uniref:Uncharacterized protein n=1 Tax=Glonium stellatum TaxID=574774 RepID=A0A8E2JWN4_9PEZI|nr:hypothetical protein AOQ84DRAFT_360674 [Glonium stellatum]
MPRISTFLVGVQGLVLICNGFVTLFAPAIVAAEGALLAGTPSCALHTLSLSSLSLGTSYLLATQQSTSARHRFMLAAVPLRILAMGLFWGDGPAWVGVTVYEAAMGLANVAVVWFEK